MVSTATQYAPVAPSKVGQTKVNKKPAPISWEAFQKKYLTREDGYKYEWVNGEVEKTKRSMDKTQLYILNNLMDFFLNLRLAGKVVGHLIAEPDLFFPDVHRRPDIVWLTKEQMYKMADGTNDIPAFVIEVISTNDQSIRVEKKMNNYRNAGVKVVWQIFPDLQTVHVYAGQHLNSMTVCTGQQICSAAPALPDFAMPVSEIFKKAL